MLPPLYSRYQSSLHSHPITHPHPPLPQTPKDLLDHPALNLLSISPSARLIICFHDIAGNLASFNRPLSYISYTSLSSPSPSNFHILTFNYRGFGLSSGTPSEEGLISDALAVVDWAMTIAGISPERIVLFGQSLGTSVEIEVFRGLMVGRGVSVAGLVGVAGFEDVKGSLGTYRLGGRMPVLELVGWEPGVLDMVGRWLDSKWESGRRTGVVVRWGEERKGGKYHVTPSHARDDPMIPFGHTERLFWHAVNGSKEDGIGVDEMEVEKGKRRTNLGERGSVVEWRNQNGVVREEILKFGVHDR